MVAATGPFGAAACLIMPLVYLFCARKVTTPTEWINNLFLQEDDENELYERLVLGLDNTSTKHNIEPYRDIISCGTMIQKQTAIAKMTRYFNPEFAPILLQALTDLNASVRVQAAASLAKIEHNFASKYVQLEKSLKGIAYSDPAWLALARVYEDYANTGLLDEYSQQTMRMKAQGIYESYLHCTKDTKVQTQLANLYMKQGQADKANHLLHNIIKAEDDAPATTILCYIESLFSLQKFAELRVIINRYMSELSRIKDYQYDIEELLYLWKCAANNNNIANVQPILEKNYAA
jgi:hypothetical protein